MTSTEYKTARQQRGTQQGVAKALHIALSTVQRREAGVWAVTEEARRAILSLPSKGKKEKTKTFPLSEVITRYHVGWDIEPEPGERCALAIRLTQAQHAAALRANVPPGDPEGMVILQDIDRIQKAFLMANPDGVCSVFITHNHKTQ